MQAGRTPFHPRSGQPSGGGESEGEASPLALPAPGGSAAAGGLGAAASPMTETARRIMMALDAMTEVVPFRNRTCLVACGSDNLSVLASLPHMA